jgi:peptidoglycan hydrolase CwlO-like protein
MPLHPDVVEERLNYIQNELIKNLREEFEQEVSALQEQINELETALQEAKDAPRGHTHEVYMEEPGSFVETGEWHG